MMRPPNRESPKKHAGLARRRVLNRALRRCNASAWPLVTRTRRLSRLRWLRGLIALLACWLWTDASAAQVNTEILRPAREREGFSADLDASLSLSRGNVEELDLGGMLKAQYQTLYPLPPAPEHEPAPVPFVRQQAFVVANGRRAEQSGNTFVDEAFAHARWTGMWHPRVGSELFVQGQLNRFQRLLARSLVGAGVRVDIVHSPALRLWGGSGYMFEHDHVDVQAGASDAAETYEHRWTSYLASRLELWGGPLLLQNTLYVQPRFDALSDFRLLEELQLLAKVTQVLSLGTKLSVLHDSAPPTGVKQTDLRLSSTLHLSF